MSTLQEQPLTLTDGEPLDTAVEPSVSEEPLRRSRRHALARPCGYYLASRVAVFLAALGAQWFAPHLHLFSAMTTGWDAKWYTLIAQHGYPHHIIDEGHGSRWAFFPAWPLAIRATVDVTHLSYVPATLILSFALGLTSAIAVWLAVREVFGTVVADRAVLLLRVLSDRVRAQPGVLRRPVHHDVRYLPLCPVAALLGHGRGLCRGRRPDEELRSRPGRVCRCRRRERIPHESQAPSTGCGVGRPTRLRGLAVVLLVDDRHAIRVRAGRAVLGGRGTSCGSSPRSWQWWTCSPGWRP